MILKTYLYYPGYETSLERVNWLKNVLVDYCGMSVITGPTSISGTGYYCVLGNSSKGKVRIEDTGSIVLYWVDDAGNKYSANTGAYIILDLSTSPRTFVIYSKNRICLCGTLLSSGALAVGSMLLLNVRAKEIYSGEVFNTNAFLDINQANLANRQSFIGLYGELVNINLTIIDFNPTYMEESGLLDSPFCLTCRYNDGRYFIPSIFRVGNNFGHLSEFTDIHGDNLSLWAQQYGSFCVCMDHIL